MVCKLNAIDVGADDDEPKFDFTCGWVEDKNRSRYVFQVNNLFEAVLRME